MANNLEGLLTGVEDPHRSLAAGARGVGRLLGCYWPSVWTLRLAIDLGHGT